MITKELLDRINALAKKSKVEGLTEEEKVEQQELRQIYLADIRGQLISQIENIRYDDGTMPERKMKH